MTIHCPHCSTGYLLPDELLGPRGARVRCPACAEMFVVSPSAAPASSRQGMEARSGTVRATATSDVAGESPAPAAPANAARESSQKAPPGPAVPEPGPAPASTAEPDPVAVATEVLDRLAKRLGGALEEARAEARVLSRFGPDVLRAYEEYRARLGERATAQAFRVALRERLAVDLIPGG